MRSEEDDDDDLFAVGDEDMSVKEDDDLFADFLDDACNDDTDPISERESRCSFVSSVLWTRGLRPSTAATRSPSRKSQSFVSSLSMSWCTGVLLAQNSSLDIFSIMPPMESKPLRNSSLLDCAAQT